MFFNLNEQEESDLKQSVEALKAFSNSETALFNYKHNGLELCCGILFIDNRKNVTFALYDTNNNPFSFFVELTTRYKDEHQFFYKRVGTDNKIMFKKDLESYKINELDATNYMVIKDSTVEAFKNLKIKTDKCRKILELIDLPMKSIEDFIKPINQNNFNTYLDIIKNNKERLEDVLILDKESRNLGFDFMNLTKENREVLLLKGDISIVLNGKKSIFNIFKK